MDKLDNGIAQLRKTTCSAAISCRHILLYCVLNASLVSYQVRPSQQRVLGIIYVGGLYRVPGSGLGETREESALLNERELPMPYTQHHYFYRLAAIWRTEFNRP